MPVVPTLRRPRSPPSRRPSAAWPGLARGPGPRVAGNRPESPRLGRVGTHGACFGAARRGALGAVHGTVGPRRDRSRPGPAAVAADDVVRALRPRRGALGFRATSAIGAAL